MNINVVCFPLPPKTRWQTSTIYARLTSLLPLFPTLTSQPPSAGIRACEQFTDKVQGVAID